MNFEWVFSLLQGILLIVIGPAILGWINWLKAQMQGRKRLFFSIFQPYADIIKLLRVPAVKPDSASWVYTMTPYVMFIAYGILAFTIPVLAFVPLLSIDMLVVIYILGLARFTLSLSGWDTGAAFGSLGGSREMFFQFLTEIGLSVIIITLSLQWNTLNLFHIILKHSAMLANTDQILTNLGLIFIPISFLLILSFETGRLPVSNPETHLELTMSSKAIILEFSGSDLALIELAETMKLSFLFALFGSLFVSFQTNYWYLNLFIFLIRIFALAAVLAWWENQQPKMRLTRVSIRAWASILFSLIAIVLIIIAKGISL